MNTRKDRSTAYERGDFVGARSSPARAGAGDWGVVLAGLYFAGLTLVWFMPFALLALGLLISYGVFLVLKTAVLWVLGSSYLVHAVGIFAGIVVFAIIGAIVESVLSDLTLPRRRGDDGPAMTSR